MRWNEVVWTTAGLIGCSIILSGCAKPEDDPDFRDQLSVTYRDPSAIEFDKGSSNRQVICGELNPHNGAGGRTGFQVFVFDRSTKKLWLAGTDGDQGDKPDQFYTELRKCNNYTDLSAVVSAQIEHTGEQLDVEVNQVTNDLNSFDK